MIVFNKPLFLGKELKLIKDAIRKGKISGDGYYTKKCHQWFEQRFGVKKALLTTSGTHALEMAAILADIQPGDEVIMPSYTFVSTANAFVLRGARIVFVDIHPDTMNIDERLVESAITDRTKAVVVVHYAGVSCDMEALRQISDRHRLILIEDAAQGVMSRYKGRYLGTIADIGCYSFHETKNYICGEGGAVLLNDAKYIERAEIIREKGTNRSKFLKGQVDKYTWVDIGSSYLPSDMNAAYLYAQLNLCEKILGRRMKIWDSYYAGLKPLRDAGRISLPVVPEFAQQNGHMFYVKCADMDTRDALIEYLKKNGVLSVFHYVPLHSSPAGLKYGRFHGEDVYTTAESQKLLRLPLWYDMKLGQVRKIVRLIGNFFNEKEKIG